MKKIWRAGVVIIAVSMALVMVNLYMQGPATQEEGPIDLARNLRDAELSGDPNRTDNSIVRSAPKQLSSEAEATVEFDTSDVLYQSFEELVPFEIFEANIREAEAGDPQSQFVVARMLEYCAGSAKDQSSINEARVHGTMPDEAIEYMEAVLAQCQPIHAQMGDLWNEAQYWLHLASESGYPLAIAKEATGPFATASEGEIRPQLLGAIRQAVGDQLLEADAFSYVVAYLANEKPSVTAHIELESWTLLYCEKSIKCSISAHLDEYVKKQYQQHDVDEIVLLANSYKSAIADGRWDDLNL